MGDLKHLGAHNITAGRPRGLTGRRRLQRMLQAYETYRHDGVLPASYEVVYGHAWVPSSQPESRGVDVRLAVPRATPGPGRHD